MHLHRLLCVDDEPEVLAGLALTLRGRYEVEVAESGEEGLRRLVRGRPFDAVVSDLQMPGMDGVAFLARCREVAPGAVRILLTGHGSVERAAAAVNQGAVARFLLKPCRPGDLLDALAGALTEAAAAAARSGDLARRGDQAFARLVEAERRATQGRMAGVIAAELANVSIAFEAALDLVAEAARAGRPPRRDDLEILRRVGDHLAAHGQNLGHLGEGAPEADGTAALRPVLAGALELLRFSGVLRHAQVDLALPEAPLALPLPPTRLEQILLALLRNAAASMDEMTGRPQRLAVRARLEGGGATAAIEVEDNGGGLTARAQARYLEPWDAEAHRRPPPGLGLLVVRHLVESRRGTLALSSREGRGTTVTLRLPVAGPAGGAAGPGEALRRSGPGHGAGSVQP